MEENTFSKRYKNFSTPELLNIIDNSEEYNSLAVEAAKLEIENRQITEEELHLIREELKERLLIKTKSLILLEKFQNKLKSFASPIISHLNPIQKAQPTIERFIKFITLLIGVLFVYSLFEKFWIFIRLFTENNLEWNIDMILYFLPLLVLPIAGLQFWFRKKTGWILTTLYISYTTVGTILLFLFELIQEYSITSNISPYSLAITYLGASLFYLILTWILCKEKIRDVFNVDNALMVITNFIAALFAVLIFRASL